MWAAVFLRKGRPLLKWGLVVAVGACVAIRLWRKNKLIISPPAAIPCSPTYLQSSIWLFCAQWAIIPMYGCDNGNWIPRLWAVWQHRRSCERILHLTEVFKSQLEMCVRVCECVCVCVCACVPACLHGGGQNTIGCGTSGQLPLERLSSLHFHEFLDAWTKPPPP